MLWQPAAGGVPARCACWLQLDLCRNTGTLPILAPDGKHLMYWSAQNPSALEGPGFLIPFSVSPDGPRLAYEPGKPEQFLRGTGWFPGFSPDGRWIAYCFYRSGRNEIEVRPPRTLESGRFRTAAR